MRSNCIDETGNIYGQLKVIKPVKEPDIRKTMWLCECSCGEQKLFNGSELRAGKRTSCGRRCNNIIEEKPGTVYGYLKIIKKDERPAKLFPDSCVHWICECQLCGTLKSISGKNLRNGDTKSCGCLESIGERLITKALTELKYDFQKEYTFPNLVGSTGKPYRFDFGVFYNNNLLFLIEFNGIQHFKNTGFSSESLEKRQERDQIKDEYCTDNGIHRIYFNNYNRTSKEISYDEIKNEIQEFYNKLTKGEQKYVQVLDYNFGSL